MKFSSLLIHLFSTVLFLSCSSSKINSTSDTVNYRKFAENKYEGKVAYVLNENNNLVICINEPYKDLKPSQPQLNYFVYDLIQEKILYEDRLIGGSVKWYSDTFIEVYSMPGIIRQDEVLEDFIVLVNVKTGESFKKNEYLKRSNK